jgi:hypothetical protein
MENSWAAAALGKSTDGGTTWQVFPGSGSVFETGDGRYQYRYLHVDPSSAPATLYLAGSGELQESTDGGESWTGLRINNLQTSVVFDSAAAAGLSHATIYTAYSASADAIVVKLDPTGTEVLFSTYLGGLDNEGANSIALDSSGKIYVTGGTASRDFPILHTDSLEDPPADGNNQPFVAVLGDADLPATSCDPVTSRLLTTAGTVEVTLPDITSSTSGTNPTITVTALDAAATAALGLSNNLGAYDVETTATYDTLGCGPDPTRGIKVAFTVQTVNDPAIFNGLVVAHGEDQNGDHVIQANEMVRYDGSASAAKVTYHDFATRTVWVYVPSLSPFVIVKSPIAQQILWNNPAPILHGTPLGPSQLNATVVGTAGGVAPGALAYTPGAGTILPPGHNTLRVDAAATADYRAASATVTIDVRYDWSGVLQPINSDGSSVFRRGSTVPVKFRLAGASAGITNAVARLSYVYVNGSAGMVNEAVSTAQATTGNLFRYDGGQYVFNWSTQGLAAGTYELRIDMGDGLIRTVRLALR